MRVLFLLLIMGCQDQALSKSACSKELKLCPDKKTQVSRQGPDCEFESCELQRGYSIKGKARSCPKMPEGLACSMMMTKEDEFAMECRKKGLTAYQCGCHDFICSGKINL